MSSGWRTAAAASMSALCILVLTGCGGASDSKAPIDGQPAVVSISDATVTEGVLSNGTALTMTNPEGVFCRVAYATRGVSAQSPDDFEAVPSTIMQFGGVPNTPLSLTIVDDNLVEPDETFQVVIALAAGSDPRCQLGKSVATITVVSNDAASVVSIANATINETTGGQALISVTNPTGRTCAVTVTSANGTAVAPADYTALNAVPFTLTGVGSLPITLTTANDTTVESPETFTLTIALAPGSDQQCQLGQATATVTINSDDAAAVISIADATVTEGVAGNQTTISMTNVVAGLSCPLTVSTANGTAAAPGDFTAKSAEAFTLDAASKTLSLAIVNDLIVETAETFTVTIALAPGADARCQIGRAAATITVVSDDRASVISIGDITVAEGATAQLPITMTNPTGVTCALTATTANGTAAAPGDFTALTALPLSINAVASTTLPVTTIDDAVPELSKTFTVTIALATNADPRCQIADGQATVTITNNDFAVVSISSVTVAEGAVATVPITMTNGTGITCNVTATTTNGSAVAPGDYSALSGFAVAATGAGGSVSVTTIQDILVETNETLTVTLALAPGADARCQLGAATATVTIVSDDVAAVISIGNLTVSEAVGTAQVPVTMTNANGVTCNLTASTANGTATAGQDYTALAASALSIVGVGATANANVDVPIINDTLIEGDQTFTVTLTLVAGSDPRCQIGDGQANVTIVSDDVVAVISIADATVTEGDATTQTTISMTNFVAGLSCPLTVSTANGRGANGADAPQDYLAMNADAFTLDAASKPLGLTIVNDILLEPPETFTITIALAGGADARCQIGDGTAAITILSN